MKYIEARKIVDPIVDGKTVLEAKDSGEMMKAVIRSKELYERAKEKADRYSERLEKLKSIEAPEVILLNEERVVAECRSKEAALVESYRDMMALAALKDVCPADSLDVLDTSRLRGCRDCAFRFSDYKGGPGIDSHFYCGIHAELTEEEKRHCRETTYILDEEGTERKAEPEEIEAYISEGRRVWRAWGYNTPCDNYEPSRYPLFMCHDDKKAMARMKEEYAGKLPDLDAENWDEESVLVNMIFCRCNQNRMGAAEKKLLDAIFGDKGEEGKEGEDEGNAGD